ncbi:MAG: phosphoglycerate kinase [Clostridiales bacterium]|jgi:phosphoglycerate kinase|nr:phosphoglycerate kinase [Clostridiales bacterium]
MNKKTICDVDVKGKKCLVRVDFNVPMKNGVITDENRINGALPTIKYLMEHGAKVILCSHLGRPYSIFSKEIKKIKPEDEGKTREELTALTVKKCSLKPVADRLNEILGGKVTFATDVIGEDAQKKVAACKDGEVVLLENLRFHSEETKNDENFCRALAKFCDIYVNDAFGTAHRAHASTAGIAQYGLCQAAVAGFLIEKELKVMGGALENPTRPFVAILGGAKVSDKIGVINNLIEKVDTIIIGGGMAYTFFKAKGYGVGTSLCEEDKVELAKELMAKAEAKGVKLVLPIDTKVAKEFPDPIDGPVDVKVVPSNQIPEDMMGLDIGPKTQQLFADTLKGAKTVIWNGPMGVFENPTLAEGTISVAKAISELTDATTIIGGGDSAAAVKKLGFADKMTHISTGGGASLEFLEGLELPGVACLDNK